MVGDELDGGGLELVGGELGGGELGLFDLVGVGDGLGFGGGELCPDGGVVTGCVVGRMPVPGGRLVAVFWPGACLRVCLPDCCVTRGAVPLTAGVGVLAAAGLGCEAGWLAGESAIFAATMMPATITKIASAEMAAARGRVTQPSDPPPSSSPIVTASAESGSSGPPASPGEPNIQAGAPPLLASLALPAPVPAVGVLPAGDALVSWAPAS